MVIMPVSLPYALHLSASVIFAASASCATLLPDASFAQTSSKSTKQVPGYYHMQLGDFQVTALYDGAVALPTALLHGISQSDTEAMLADMFVPLTKDGVQTAVKGYLEIGQASCRERGCQYV